MSPSSQIAHYKITGKLGEGGMGAVYRAIDTKLNREVAVKILPDAFAADPDRLARFSREAQLLASLNHPNIAAIYGVEERALVMELVGGETLSGPLEDPLPVIHQLIDALEYAHEKGVVHRDLKPANIKLTAEGRVKVLDFGLAKALTSDTGSTANSANSPTLTMQATTAGTIMGTAAYMAPEQARGHNVDKRADIWAFGVVVYELVTGRRLFTGDSVSDTLAAVLRQDVDLGAVPSSLRHLLEKCLARDPRQRMRDIGDGRILLEEPPSAAAPARRPWLPWAVAGIATAVAGTLAAIHFREPPPRAEIVRFQISAPDKLGFGPAFALSPDGRQLAFTAPAADGRTFIWVRPLNSVESKALPATEGANYLPFWSPDSRFLVFATGGKLRKVDAAGGPAQVLCDAPPIVIGGSWSPAGVILFSSNSGVILKVPAGGGVATPVTKLLPQDSYHCHPSFLPDGRHFLYARISSQTVTQGMFLGSVDVKPEDQGSRRVTTAQYAIYMPGAAPNSGYLLFLRDRSLMAQPFDAGRLETQGEAIPVADPVAQYVTRGLFSASANGTLAYQSGSGASIRLTWYDRHGNMLDYIAEPSPFRHPRISPDGTRLAIRRQDLVSGNFDVWLRDLTRPGGMRFTFDPAAEGMPVWSPDGKQIIFVSNRSGVDDLYLKPSNLGVGEKLVLHTSEPKGPTDWSPDGRYLIYSSEDPKTGSDLWLLPNPGDPSGDHTPILFLRTEFRETQAQFSPDGRWVAYMSDASSKPEIYVRPFPPSKDGAGVWMISDGGGVQPRWNRNGKELLYFNGRRLMSAEIATAGGFRASQAKPVMDVALPLYGGGDIFSALDWDVSPDGKRFLLVTESADRASAPITVVLNWKEGIRK
jgi:eukaryotic-like serine/threonine-protein kinase